MVQTITGNAGGGYSGYVQPPYATGNGYAPAEAQFASDMSGFVNPWGAALLPWAKAAGQVQSSLAHASANVSPLADAAASYAGRSIYTIGQLGQNTIKYISSGVADTANTVGGVVTDGLKGIHNMANAVVQDAQNVAKSINTDYLFTVLIIGAVAVAVIYLLHEHPEVGRTIAKGAALAA